MERIKFLHFSDLHLDMPFSSIGAGNGKSLTRRKDLKKVFRRIIQVADMEKVDLVLIGGDLYEHDYVRKSTINFINEGFKTIPDIKIFIIPGNHDPYTIDSYYRNYEWSNNVYILNADNPVFTPEDMGVRIYGAGLDGRSGMGPLIDGTEPVNAALINILLIHGTVDMNIGKNIYNPFESSRLDSLGVDYIGLGHFHKQFCASGSRGTIYNPGSPEPLGFDEIGEHSVLIGTISKETREKASLKVRPVYVNEKSYEHIEIDANGCNNDEQVIQKVSEALNGKDCSSVLARVVLRGYVEQGYKVGKEYISSQFDDKIFFMKLVDETIPDYDFETMKSEPGLRGLFVRKMLSLIESCDDKKRADILRKALYMGMEGLEKGEITVRQE